jgi:hypothetical protein
MKKPWRGLSERFGDVTPGLFSDEAARPTTTAGVSP